MVKSKPQNPSKKKEVHQDHSSATGKPGSLSLFFVVNEDMALLIWDFLMIIVIVLLISVITHDKVSLLLLEVVPSLRRIVENLVSSETCQKQNREEVKHRSWRRSIFPFREIEGLRSRVSVHSNSFYSSPHLLISFLISFIVSHNSIFIVITLDVEADLGRRLNGCLNVDKSLFNGCQVIDVLCRVVAARPD